MDARIEAHLSALFKEARKRAMRKAWRKQAGNTKPVVQRYMSRKTEFGTDPFGSEGHRTSVKTMFVATGRAFTYRVSENVLGKAWQKTRGGCLAMVQCSSLRE